MGYRTKALVLALFCLLAVSTLLTTTANAVVKEMEEESHVADVNIGSRKDLEEHAMGHTGEVTKELDMEVLEDEKHYRRHHHSRYRGGGGRRHRRGGRYGRGGGRRHRRGGRYGRGGGRRHGHGHCHGPRC